MQSSLNRVTGRTVLGAVLATALLGMLVFLRGPYAAVRTLGGGPLPDERPWQPADLAPWLESLGEAGRATYQRFLVLDAAFMTLVATPTFILLAAWVLRRWLPARPWALGLVWFLLIPAAADLVENVVLYQAAGRHPDLGSLPLALAARATAVKTSLAMVLHPLVLGAGVLTVLGDGLRRLRRGAAPG